MFVFLVKYNSTRTRSLFFSLLSRPIGRKSCCNLEGYVVGSVKFLPTFLSMLKPAMRTVVTEDVNGLSR